MSELSSTGGLIQSPRPIALCGMGGVGKSTLAAGFARSCEARRAFPDGVIWLSAGRESNRSTRLRNFQAIAAALEAEVPNQFDDYNIARASLAELLRDKACLIALDNVWDLEDVHDYIHSIPSRSRLIFTTRDGAIATASGAIEQWILPLTPPESFKFMASWPGGGQTKLEGAAQTQSNRKTVADLAEVAKECGHLPLALALASAAHTEGTSWQSILEALQASELDYLEHELGSLGRTLGLSIGALSATDQETYLTLAIFHRSTPTPDHAIERFWSSHFGMTRRENERLITRLNRKSLLRCTEVDGKRYVAVHDLQYDYMRSIMSSDKWISLHASLLDSYSAAYSAHWNPPIEDEYILRALFYHLRESQRVADMVQFAGDLEFVSLKTSRYSAQLVESDVEEALSFDTANLLLNDLAKTLRLSGHILDKCDRAAVLTTLYGRLEDASVHVFPGQSITIMPEFVLPDLPHPAMVRVFRGHWNSVNSCALSPDNDQCYSASRDGSIKRWSLTSGLMLDSLEWGATEVTACIVSPSGELLTASYGVDDVQTRGSDNLDGGILRVWNSILSETLVEALGHTKRILGLDVSADGLWAATCGRDSTIRIWNARTGDTECVLTGHDQEVIDVAFSPDATLLASASSDSTIKLWNIERREELCTLVGHADKVVSCQFSPDGYELVSSSYDAVAIRWDVRTAAIVQRYVGHSNIITRCRYSPDGSKLVTAGHNNIRVWDVATGSELGVLYGHSDIVSDAVFTTDGNFVLSASYDCTLRLWDLHKLSDGSHGERIGLIRSEPLSDEEVLTVSDRGRISVYATKSMSQRREGLTNKLSWGPLGISLSGDKIVISVVGIGLKILDVGSNSTGVLEPDWQALERKRGRRIRLPHNTRIVGCGFADWDRRIVAVGANGEICIWNSTTLRKLRTIKTHDLVNCCAIDLPAPIVCIGSGNPLMVFDTNTIRAWDIRNGAEMTRARIGHYGGQINGCAIRADLGYAATVAANGELTLWDTKSWTATETAVSVRRAPRRG